MSSADSCKVQALAMCYITQCLSTTTVTKWPIKHNNYILMYQYPPPVRWWPHSCIWRSSWADLWSVSAAEPLRTQRRCSQWTTCVASYPPLSVEKHTQEHYVSDATCCYGRVVSPSSVSISPLPVCWYQLRLLVWLWCKEGEPCNLWSSPLE